MSAFQALVGPVQPTSNDSETAFNSNNPNDRNFNITITIPPGKPLESGPHEVSAGCNDNDECVCITNEQPEGLSPSDESHHERSDQIEHLDNNTRFIYHKNFPITRYSRKWKRQEVQGLCCLTVELICLVTLALVSLQAMGYLGDLGEDGHVPHTFSWKILRDFFTYEEVSSNSNKDCLYMPSGRIKRPRGHISNRIFGNLDEEEVDYGAARDDSDILDNNIITQPRPQPENFNGDSHNLNAKQCEYNKNRRSMEWLLKMFSANFMAVINTITSGWFLSSLWVRRRRGLQVILLIPSFLCFFMSIFQQIPVTFHYNYVNMLLRDEMRAAYAHSAPPFYVAPIMEETQIHMQCCGVEYPATWENDGLDVGYPGSCCNTTAFDCKGKSSIPKNQAWSKGCYHQQYERVRFFERWTLFILGFKIIAEIGIFCALSDLTRYEYPAPDTIENSRCEYRDYVVKCKGVARIRGVTKDGRIVVKSNFLAWGLTPSRTDMVNGLLLHLKNDLNQSKGSVEIIKRLNLSSFLNEDIQVDLRRKNRGIYVFTVI